MFSDGISPSSPFCLCICAVQTFKSQHPGLSTVISKCQINLRTIALNIKELNHPLETELEQILILVLLNHLILCKEKEEPKCEECLKVSSVIPHPGLPFSGVPSMTGNPLGHTCIRNILLHGFHLTFCILFIYIITVQRYTQVIIAFSVMFSNTLEFPCVCF